MSLSSCFSCKPAMFHQVSGSLRGKIHVSPSGAERRSVFALRSVNTSFSGRHMVAQGGSLGAQGSFVGGSRVTYLPQLTKFTPDRKRTTPAACWITCSQIASSSFTWATVFVLPFYTLMVVAPNAAVTKKTMESNIPYIVLGILYTYLLYLSWTPDTLRSMFASKYLLPELPGMTKLFANEVTVSSAWIHLLTVDLFAARQVFKDGLENKIETRHSVSLCLLFCPVGILTHAITKALTKGDQYIHGGTKAPK